MNQQQSQTVQVVQKNAGCLSGCGTIFAVIVVLGLAIAYWYVAIPVVILLVGGWLWYRNQQKQKLPAPKAGPQDSWLNRIAILLSGQGYAERTRNTGQQLAGSPLQGDLVMDGHGMRMFVNAMPDEYAATQTANRLRAQADFQRGLARKTVEVQSQGRLIFIAKSQAGVVDSTSLKSAIESVAQILPTEQGQKSLEAETRPMAKPPVSSAEADVFGKLEKLAALRDSGVITANEFEAKKADLLKRL